uniref:OCEL domain-containing protein n=1 Tax=Mola mola TaxID=94237 RepID=A0A3Q3W5C0_MOLML
MSALKESRCYGLSSGRLSRGGDVSVFHVKLTDSAARAIGSIQNGKGSPSHPTICFNGNQGRITIPGSENGEELRFFTFGVTNVARDNPHGSFDCVQQLSTGASEELSCLGVIQKKMTVNATDDSYDKARQSMAQAEEETRSRGAIVIKHGGRYQGRKHVCVVTQEITPAEEHRWPGDTFVLFCYYPGKKNKPKKNPLSAILHWLLYSKEAGTKTSTSSLKACLNSRNNTFLLKDGLYKELQKDWPGYTSGDQQLLKRILVRRLFQPQQNLLTVPEAQVSPLRDTPNSSPAHRPKPSLPEEYTDPLASKKPRISHLSNKAATGNNRQRDSLDPRRLFDSLSEVCQREAEAAKRLEPTSCPQEPKATADQPQPNSDRPASPLTVPSLDRHTIKRKKSKHKHRAQVSPDFLLTLLMQFDMILWTYTGICSHPQRQSYKQDFNREYSEYRDLHARIDTVTRQFMELDTQLKQLHHESHKYKTVHNKILQEYRKIKKSNPNYQQEKSRCEYLHNKLAHIKKLISEYDQKQLRLGDSSLN